MNYDTNTSKPRNFFNPETPADYAGIEMWGRGSSGPDYIRQVQEQAVRQRAPFDALYHRDDGPAATGGWTCVRHLRIDHDTRVAFQQRFPGADIASLPGADTTSFRARDVVQGACLKALDLVTKRHSAFPDFEALVNAGLHHSYTPTIYCGASTGTVAFASGERTVLADAFDAAMEAAGCDTKAYRQ